MGSNAAMMKKAMTLFSAVNESALLGQLTFRTQFLND
jgi:hypothetical protein